MENKTVHILLVEDNEDHCKLVSRAFESRGWGGTLRVVATLREARACMKQSHPDLVIADLRLPDGQGIDLVRVPHDGAPYPVIVMTSHGDEQHAVEAMKAGALDYVVKSEVTLADMPHSAQRALREWQVTMKRKEAEEVLKLTNERLRTLTIQLSAAEEAERKRISRDLHDQFGQTLTCLKYDLSWLASSVTDNGLVESRASFLDKIHSMTALVDSTIHSVRHISSFLRPLVLDDFGLVAALEWLGEDLEARTHLPCHVVIAPQAYKVPLHESQSTTLFRIAQELLTNVMRHAQASRIQVVFSVEADMFTLEVCDNGKGIKEDEIPGSGSYGLRGIRERTWLLGGDFSLHGQPGTGTTAKVRIPTG